MTVSRSARWLSALVVVPGVAAALLVTLASQLGVSSFDAEAAALSDALDRDLQRHDADALITVAILPLEVQGDRRGLAAVAAGAEHTLRQTLGGISDLRLIGRQSSADVAARPIAIRSKARLLDASHLVQGSVVEQGDGLRLAVSVTQPGRADQMVAESHWDTSEAQLSLAISSLVSYVVEHLGLSGLEAAADAGMLAPDGVAERYAAAALIERDNAPDILAGLERLDAWLQQHPLDTEAWEARIRGHERMTWVDAKRSAAHTALRDQAIDAYMNLGIDTPFRRRMLAARLGPSGQLTERFLAYQHARQVFPAQFTYNRGAMFDLCRAGYVQRCLEQALGLARQDPLSAGAHVDLATVHFVAGDIEASRRHAQLARQLGAAIGDYLLGVVSIWDGDWAAVRRHLVPGLARLQLDSDWLEPLLAALANPALRAQALEALAASEPTTRHWMDQFHGAFILLGAMDAAYQAADHLIEHGAETWSIYLWQPRFRSFRADPRFVPMSERLGLPTVWRSFGPPDLCEQRPAEDFCVQLGLAAAG